MPRKRQEKVYGAPRGSLALFDPRRRGAAAVTSLSWDYAAGHRVPEHFHDDDQFVYAVQGVMTVRTQDGLWVVPPRRAVWIPAPVPHSIEMGGAVTMKTLYLAPGLAKGLPRTCQVIHVSPLLHELTLRACELRSLHGQVPREAHVIAILLDTLETSPTLSLQLPMPPDPRALRIAEALVADPGEGRTLADLCRAAGASKRTLERLFRQGTGMPLRTWRQQLRLLHAVRMLTAGAKVTAVALDAGYASPSAFIAMFRRALGTTPSAYLARDGGSLRASTRTRKSVP
jgi:AraC-like DNA-binding protein/quercetin dioxygenase-like cupin family protein